MNYYSRGHIIFVSFSNIARLDYEDSRNLDVLQRNHTLQHCNTATLQHCNTIRDSLTHAHGL